MVIRLDGDNLELAATTAYLGGRVSDAMEGLQRAQQYHARQGDHRRAARCAFWLGFMLLDRGELAQGSGWLARARRLLEHEPPDCAEQGYLLLPAILEQLQAGEHAAAQVTAARAAGIGRQAGEADLVGLAVFFQGAATVAGGGVAEGLALLDEAMVAVVAGELSPEVTGWIYCGVIDVCQEVAELRRAREWTEALSAWCDSRPGMVTFTGQCLVHRAEILRLGGAWAEAVEAARAAERLAEADDEQAIGAASYQQAEAHRVLGQFEAAEEAYQLASRWGHEPQPGLALLRLAQGRTRAAGAAIRRVLGETGAPLARARLLPGAVEILLATGDGAAAGRPPPTWPGSPTATGPRPCSPRPTTPAGRCCWPRATPGPRWPSCAAPGGRGGSWRRRTRRQGPGCWSAWPAGRSATRTPRPWSLTPPGRYWPGSAPPSTWTASTSWPGGRARPPGPPA